MNEWWAQFVTWIGNTISLSAILGSLAGVLPAWAAVIAVLYYMIEIYESKTVQHWLATRRLRRIAAAQKLIEYLNAQIKIADERSRLEAEKKIRVAIDELQQKEATAVVVGQTLIVPAGLPPEKLPPVPPV